MSAISSVAALDTRRVRVTFSASVPVSDPTAATDALNPANWTFTGQVPAPTAEVSAVSVERYGTSTTTVDVLTDTDLSPGRNYLVIAKPAASGGITGVAANPSDRHTFVAFMPAQPARRSFAVADMIPRKKWREDASGDLALYVAILQDQLTILLHTVDRWTDILDPDICPESFLDLMLADLGNPFVNIGASTIEKRKLVGLLVAIYKQKGTGPGLVNAIRLFMGFWSTILKYNAQGCVLSGSGEGEEQASTLDVDFILGGRDVEYDFNLRIGTPAGRNLAIEEEARVRAIAEWIKPAHTKLFGVDGALPPPLPATGVAAAGHGDDTIRVSWPEVTDAAGYRIYYRTAPGVTPLNSSYHDVSTVLLWDQTVTTGTTMYYSVAALSEAGNEGVLSAEVSATAP